MGAASVTSSAGERGAPFHVRNHKAQVMHCRLVEKVKDVRAWIIGALSIVHDRAVTHTHASSRHSEHFGGVLVVVGAS